MSGLRRKIIELVAKSDQMLDPIIDEHISKRREVTTEEDLVEVLLKFQEDELDDDRNLSFSLTRSNIKAIILVRHFDFEAQNRNILCWVSIQN